MPKKKKKKNFFFWGATIRIQLYCTVRVLTVSKNITLNLVRLVLLVANYIWHGGGYVKLFGRIS